jgi:predicted transcriptional regulator
MSIRRRRRTRSTGVTLEVVVLEYLQELAEKDDRDRSFCINQIVREHAERHGRTLPTATRPPRPPPATCQE